MKDIPEIAPEIRGLLEEIVANPRSAIRLAPRRALSSWFECGEAIRATDVSKDKAARHLVAAHREELAALLREASWISYWKAPVLTFRPTGGDGVPYHPTQREPEWTRRAKQVARGPADHSTSVELLRSCITGIKPKQGWVLAQASLSLVPNDKTRFNVALSAQWTTPRTAIVLFRRLATLSQTPAFKALVLQSLGTQACHLGMFADARRLYRSSSDLDCHTPYSLGCAFNLACVLGDVAQAREEATEFGALFGTEDPRVNELRDLLLEWRKARSMRELEKARMVVSRIGEGIPNVAKTLCQGFEA